MTGKKLSVVREQAPVVVRSTTKPFDEFASMAKDLGREYLDIRRVLHETEKNKLAPSTALERVTKELAYARSLGGFSRIVQQCETFIDLYDVGDDQYPSEVSKRVAQLVGCFPNANVGDPEVYVRTLIDDVAGMECSLIELEAACRKLRRTSKFLPTISEILKAIADEQTVWSDRFWAINGRLEAAIEDLEARKVELEAEVAANNEQKRLAQEAEHRNKVAFPAGATVVHNQHGLGSVERHNGEFIVVGTWGARSTLARPDTLTLVELINDPPCIGRRVYHSKIGWGVVEETDIGFSAVVRAERDDQKREVDIFEMYVERGSFLG